MTREQELRGLFGDTEDLACRRLTVGTQTAAVYYIDGLCAGAEIADTVVRPLCRGVRPGTAQEVFLQARDSSVCNASMEQAQTARQIADRLLHGFCAVLLDDSLPALCFEVKTGEKRGPSAPESENTVKGAKDAFVETARTNTGLIRRHLRSAQLRFVSRRVGRCTQNDATVCWLEGRCEPSLVQRMLRRLEQLDMDGFILPASVEEAVTGSRRTAFPLLQYTERTDTFCQGLLEGKVGLLVDGLPLGYLAPVSLSGLMESSEDRAVDYVSASILRVLRYLALFVSLLLPAVYVAMATFHQQMLPTKLLLAIIASKKDVPFSTLLEVAGLLAAFELLQEAGLHLPQAIGTAVSIIGGLVVGTAAVDADLVSPAALIVTASGGICGFTLPNRDLSDAIRVWRLALTALAGAAGLLGVAAGVVALCIHLAGLTSLDEAYLAPFSQARGGGVLMRRRVTANGRTEAEE